MQSFKIKLEKYEKFYPIFTNFRFDSIELAASISPTHFVREEIHGQRVGLAQTTVYQGLGDNKYF